MAGLTMGLEPFTALRGQLPQHFVVKKLSRTALDHRWILSFQVHFTFAKGMDRKGRSLPEQPDEASLQFMPSHQASSPQIAEEAYLAGLSRNERVVDIEQRGQRARGDGRSGPDQRRMKVVIAMHGVGMTGE